LVSNVNLKPIVNLQIVVAFITLLYAIIRTGGSTLTFSTFNDLFALGNQCNSGNLSESREHGMFHGGGGKDPFLGIPGIEFGHTLLLFRATMKE